MKRGLLVAMAVASAGACSPANVPVPRDTGTDAGAATDSGTGDSVVAHACSDSAYARCSQIQTCSSTAVQLRFGDLRTCEALYSAQCINNIVAPSSGTTPATVETCVQGISKWSCSDYLFNQNPPPACQPAIGQLANGAPCGVNPQCQSGFCSIVPGRTCGTCAAAPKAGDSCAKLASCGTSLNCMSATLECQAYGQLGGACAPGRSCAAGLACVGYNAQTGAQGTCQPTVAMRGAPCVFLGPGCDQFAGLSCNAQTETCEIAAIVGAGAACGLVANQQAYCASSGQCAVGACQGASGVGAPCDLVGGPACIDISRCIVGADGGTSGTCQVPSGSSCR